MKYFIEEDKNIGKVPVGVKTEVQFKYVGDGVFKSATSSCGCSKPSWDSIGQTIDVIYTPKEIPPHKVEDGEYIPSLNVTATFDYSGVEKKHILKFIATVFQDAV
jgi:hypothetical protein